MKNMIKISLKDLSERDTYKLLTGSIIPRPIAFITTLSKDNIINAAPFSYFNIVSSRPALISISIERKNGSIKDTAENILNEKSFVIHTVDEKNIYDVNQTALSLPKDQSELSFTSFHRVESDDIRVPGIKESRIRMECALEKHIPIYENDMITTDLIIGRVLKMHIDESVYKDGKIDFQTLHPMSRLAGPNYASIGPIITIERPK